MQHCGIVAEWKFMYRCVDGNEICQKQNALGATHAAFENQKTLEQ